MNYHEINNKDQMWYKLGIHFCKLKKYCDTIYFDILNRQFGKSYKLGKKFNLLCNKYLSRLACTLDDIIQADYHININTLDSIEANIYITSVFYNLYSYDNKEIISYNEKIDGTGSNKILHLRSYPNLGEIYNKQFTYEEKEFIDKFIQNLNEYLVNIQIFINYNSKYKDRLDKNIIKIQNYLFKLMPEISEVPILN